jgi:ankyrin repeat protein
MKDMKDYIFIHAIGRNNFARFIKKSTDGPTGENFNAFYISETADPSQTLPTISPQWPTHRNSILVAFEGNSTAFEGGFTRNAVSSPFFLDAQVENMPEKLHFIQTSYLQKTSMSSRAIFSVSKFIEKADSKFAKRQIKFSDTIFADGKRAPMLINSLGSMIQPHNEAHIRGALCKIKYIVINSDNLVDNLKQKNFEQIENAFSLHQMITNKRDDVVKFPNKPENIKLLNNFIDIEILRGTLALQKIAHLQRMLKYHELNPTTDTNQEMQLSFSHKDKKSQFAFSKSLISKDELFLIEDGEISKNQEIWINSQKTKIQKEIHDIYREIEVFSSSFEASEDSPLKTLKSTAETVQAIIYSSANQDNLEKNYEQEQDRIKSWEESAKTNLQLRFLFKKKIIFDLQKEVPFRVLQTKFRNNSQLSEFNLQNFLTNGGPSPDKLFQDMASKKLDYAIIGIGSIFLKNEGEAKIFMTAFSAFDKEFQKSILENAIINHNIDFVESVLKHKSEDPAYFVFSTIFNRDLEGLKTHLSKKGKDKTAMIPFDTPIHLATQLENDEAIKVILEKRSTSTVNAKNDKEETPLHIASRNGSVSTAEILLENGAKDSKSKTDQGCFSIAHMASMHGHTNIVKILYNFNLNVEGPNSETPAFMAIKNRYSDTAKFIIGKLNPNSLGIKSSSTLTLKQIATKIMDYQSLKLLIDYQVTEKKLLTDQFTALHYSAQNGDVKSTILILEKCTPTQRKTQLENLFEGKTPLAMAIMHNRYEVTKILLDNSPFDIDKPFTYSSNGFNFSCEVTPLQAAILNRNLRITKLLLSSGRFDANKGVELIDNVNQKKVKELNLSLLDLAIFINSFEIFNLLLKSGVEITQNIEKGRFRGYNSLHLASLAVPSNISIVKALIQSEKLDINAQIHGNSLISALSIAMVTNHFEVTKFLLSKGADIRMVVNCPQTFIKENNARIIEFFLEKKLSRIYVENLRTYPEQRRNEIIYEAAKDNCTNLLRQLLDTDIYKIDEVIPSAISQKNPEIFNLFLEKLGEDVDMNTFGIHNGLTLLHNAIRQKNSEVVKILLQRKEANPNQFCNNITALEFAMQIANASQDSNKYIENASTVKALLNANADVEKITDEKECKLLLYIASENGNLEVVKSLLSKGVKTDTYFYGFNAIHASIINGNNEITKLLLEQDDLNISCPVRKTFDKNDSLNALELAIKEDNLEILEIMLSKNIDLIDKPNFLGFTLLQFAIKENKFDAFKLLIEKGADYNFKLNLDQTKCTNNFEYTPLAYAILHRKTEMVKFLVEKGVNFDDAVYKDKGSKTLLNALQFIARYEKEDTEILGFLLDKGARTDIIVNEGDFFKGLNLLQLAVMNESSNNDKTLDILIDRVGIDTGAITEGMLKRYSTFQLAVSFDKRKVVNKFLSRGAKIDEFIQTETGEHISTLEISFRHSSENLIKDLLLRDPNYTKSLKTLKNTYVQNIFIKDFREAIGILFEKSSIDFSTIINDSITSEDENVKKYFFLTFLQSAILQNQEEMVDFLLSKNAKVDKRITQGDHSGDNSIHLCIKNSESTAIFSKLLPQSNPEEYDSGGLAPIHLMVENFKYKFMEIYLDLEGANPNIPSMHSPKYSALHLAINNGDQKMTEILLTKADVNVLDETGLAPIHLATIKEHYGILEILISHPQININETVKDGEYKGYSALHIAIINQNTKLIEILFKNDQIDVNKPIEDGKFKSFSPLELAVYLNRELSLKALLDCETKKIDVKKIAESGKNKGYSPLLWTILQHKLSTAKQLVNAGADVNEVIKTEGEFFGLNYLQLGLFHCGHKELGTFLMKSANREDFDKPIEEGKHKGSTTISIIMNENILPWIQFKEDRQILLEKLLPETIAQIKASQLSTEKMKMLPEGMAGALAEAGAGAGVGSWSEASAGMGSQDDPMDIPINWAEAYNITGNKFGDSSIDGEGASSSLIFGEGGASSSIPAILVSSVDQFSKESLQQKYTEIMREVNSDFKREYGEGIFESHKKLLEKKYKEFMDKGNENLEEYLGNATIDIIENYKKLAEKQITYGKANNRFDSIYSGLLIEKHLEFVINQYEGYQAYKEQVQAPNSVIRQQLSVSTNLAQITAQTDSNPTQNMTQFAQPNPNAQIRQRERDDRSERATKRARF